MKEVVIVSIATMKSIKPITWSNAQPIKIPLHYPCIICFSADYRFGNCSRKVEIQNMFRTKLFNCSIVAYKPPKLIMFQ